MHCILRCTCGGNEGWGNLFRLLVIRKRLVKYYKYKITLIVQGNTQVKKYLNSLDIDFIFLNEKNLKKEKEILKKLRFFDLCIIEMLNPTIAIQKIYAQKSKKIVILDDVLKNKYISDILISAQKSIIDPKKINNTKFYSGYKYFPFNEKFEKYSNKKKKIKKKLKNITILLGGSLYENILTRLAYELKKFDKVKFIVGAELKNQFIKKIKKINDRFNIIYLPKNLPKIIFDSDIVISGGGYAKMEVAFIGTPQISIAVHKHQIDLLNKFKKKFNINYLQISQLKFIKNEICKMNYKKRVNQYLKYKKYFNRNGVDKIISKIL